MRIPTFNELLVPKFSTGEKCKFSYGRFSKLAILPRNIFSHEQGTNTEMNVWI
jgi:hypothetical protein